SYWESALYVMAEAFGVALERVEHFREYKLAQREFTTSSGLHVGAGTISALHWGLIGRVGGEKRFLIEHYERLDKSDAPDWDQPPGQGGYRFKIGGTPGMTVDMAFDGDPLIAAEWATANRALNVVADVCNAPSGIVTSFTAFRSRPGYMIEPQ